MLKLIGAILVIVILVLAGYSVYKQNPSIFKVDQVTSGNAKRTVEKSLSNIPAISSQDPMARITVNQPHLSGHSMRVERIGGTTQVILEYRPKGQVHDFPVLTIGEWNKKDIPSSEIKFEEITIDGKKARLYKDSQMIFLEDLPIGIKYSRETGQLGYLADSEFQSLLNSIQID